MGITVATVRVAANTSNGTQDITTADLGGLTPKAALFFMTRASADGSVTPDSAFCIGAATGASNEWCFGGQAQDAQATTITDRFSESDRCVAIQNTAGTIEASAEFNSWLTDGVRINWVAAPATAYLVTVVLFAGTDLSAYAGTRDLGNTVDLEANITEPGFQPDIVFAAMSTLANLDSLSAGVNFSFGVAHELTGTVTQRSLSYRSNDAQAAVGMLAHLSTLYGIVSMNSSGGVTWGGEFANFDANGFSVFTRIGVGGNVDFGYLALDFGGVASSWVGTVASPTATGNNSQTGPGFKPQFVAQGLSMALAVDTGYNTDNANSFGVGVITANAQFSNALWDDDAAADSNSECISDNLPINIQNGVDGTGLAASFVSFDTTGWTVNYSDVEAAAKQSWAVAIQEMGGATSISASDTLGISISESASVVVLVSPSDTLSISLTESSTSQLSVNPTDTENISLTESSSVVVSVSPNDSVSLSITESASSAGSATPSDPQNISISETASILVTVSVSDIASLSLTESASVIISVVASVSDTFSLSITESSSLVITIPAVYTASPADIVVQDVQLFAVSLDGNVVYNISVGDT